MQYDEEFPFQLPAYSLSPSSSALSISSTRKRKYLPRKRYSPYALAQRSIHQMNISYVDAAYVEAHVELVQPQIPLQAVGALLQPPERGVRAFVRNIGLGAIVFGLLAKCVNLLWRGLLGDLA